MDAGLFDRTLQLDHEGDLIFLPLAEGATRKEVLGCLRASGGVPGDFTPGLSEHTFSPVGQRTGHFRERLELPDGLKELVPRAFDVVGDIAVLKLDDALQPHREAVGRALLETHGNVRLVAADTGVEGKLRVRKLTAIAGEGGFVTEHREGGLRFTVDLSRVYFSPRLAFERERVVELAREEGDRTVLDMFSGVGPFAVAIARRTDVESVWAMDLNPAAVEYLRRNVGRNGVDGKVRIMEGDAGHLVPGLVAESGGPLADRVIMNHPHGASSFLDAALEAVRPGGTVHYHEIMEREHVIARLEELARSGEALGRTVGAEHVREVRTYSAAMDHLCFDLRVR
jgi:tRNA (guanine37-N1)-methyltransferase